MAEGSDEPRPEFEEVGGGAVKTFLEHLEDLRWVLIKSAAATLIAMMVCLFNVQRLMAVLRWPMIRAEKRHIILLPDTTNQMVTFQIGSARLPALDLKTNRIGALELGTNQHVTVQLEPVQLGGQQLMSWRVVPTPPDASENTGPVLIFMGPAESFLFSLHMAFFGGLILASPFVLYYVGQFLMPALKIKEKKYFLRAFYIGIGLFFAGVAFAYFVIMPPALKFAQQYSLWMGVQSPIWQVGPYMSFVLKFMLGMGLGFELPVVLLALVKIGLLNYQKLSSMRRYMIVGNLILGALLTTPEPFTQIIMAIALQMLFETSVWIAWYWERQEKKTEKG
ncbi:MAG: twin-arginine translocase subunit TatC [Verrucomicrobiota bacterium]|jgi:sec-independent protein translocase protein TatC